MLKAHAGEITALTCNQGMLISTGKDDTLAIFHCNQGEYTFIRHVSLNSGYFASSLDCFNGRVLIGFDNGRIQVMAADGTERRTVSVNHHEGENWGIEVVPDKGTFLTVGDDNKILEINVRTKEVVKEGVVWSPELCGETKYKTEKQFCTASSTSPYPIQQQGRGIAYSPHHNHVAISNNFGDITILDYNDFSKRITTLFLSQEWCEVMKYSPDGRFFAAGSHD